MNLNIDIVEITAGVNHLIEASRLLQKKYPDLSLELLHMGNSILEANSIPVTDSEELQGITNKIASGVTK